VWPFDCRTCKVYEKQIEVERKRADSLMLQLAQERKDNLDVISRAARIPSISPGEIPTAPAPVPIRNSNTWRTKRRHLEQRDRERAPEAKAAEARMQSIIEKNEKEAGIGGKTPEEAVNLRASNSSVNSESV
jgi:hypothetical protein